MTAIRTDDDEPGVVRVSGTGPLRRVTIDNPPINLLDARLLIDLDRVTGELAEDPQVRVVIFDSADADFFVAHGDMTIVDDPAEFSALPVAREQPERWNPMMRLNERVRAMPQITIGVLRGFARGGGAELFSVMDLRFASLERAGLAHPEAPTGIIPGAGNTAYLPRLVGRARALEVVLGGRLTDAETAERWGWVNRALPDADLDAYVDRLAADIASRAPGVVEATVAAIDASSDSIPHGLDVANERLGALFATDIAVRLNQTALAMGAQTREGERDLEGLLRVAKN